MARHLRDLHQDLVMSRCHATLERRAVRVAYAIAWIPMLLCLAVTAGCGPGDDRQPLSGTVSWQGKPLPKGVITFYPKGAGSTVGCTIVDGTFSIALQKGATPGSYRVQIVAFRPTGRRELDIERNERVDVEEQYLPNRFNTASTLEVVIKPGVKNELAFDLEPGK